MTSRLDARRAARRKKQKRNNNRSIIALILFILFVATVLGAIASLPVFKIEGVEATGSRLLSPDEAVRIADIPLGDSIFLTNFNRARKRLLQIPVVKSVSFIRLLPARVLIKIVERKEAIICVLKDKQSLILDKDGIVLNPGGVMNPGVAFPDITNLPVMNGLEESWLDQGKYIRADVGRDVLKLLSEFEGFIVPQKLQIDVADISDINIVVDDVLKVRIGGVDDLKEKMLVFESIYDRVKNKKNDIDYIDISSLQFPVVKYK